MGIYYGKADFITYGRPSLFLDFANKKSLIDRISGNNLISFSRNSIATYYGADGYIKTAAANEPRFDHDSTTGESLGLSIEPSATNFFTNSSEMTFLGSNGTLVSGTFSLYSTLRPDGQTDNVRRIQVSTRAYNLMYDSLSDSRLASASSTMSYWVKNIGGSSVTYATGQGGGFGNYIFTTVPNDGIWYPITINGINADSSGKVRFLTVLSSLAPATDPATNPYDLLFWGGQFEIGTRATSYIPTTSGITTRSSDNATLTSLNFYNSTTSSIVVYYDTAVGTSTLTQPLLSFDDNSVNNEIKVSSAATTSLPTLSIVNAGVTTVSIGTFPNPIAINKDYKLSVSLKNNQFSLTSDGIGTITTTSGSIPTGITTMRIGTDKSGNILNGHIKRISYYEKEFDINSLKSLSYNNLFNGENIVVDGLVFCVDAGNRKSYPGSETAWYDFGASGSTGQLVNSPVYNSSNLGYLQFVTDDYARFQNSTFLDTQTPTVEVWIKTNATNQNGFWFEKGTVGTQYALFQEGTSIQWRQKIAIGLTNLTTPTATYINTSNWYQVVATYTSGSRKLYINGVLVNSDTQSGTIDTNTGGMSIGAYGGYSGAKSYYYNGNLSVCRIYNRELTSTEILQNFNATRSRYGI